MNGGEEAIEAYREQLARELATIDMRAIPGFGKNGAPWGLELATTMVLPRLRGIRGEAAPEAVGQVLAQHSAVVVQGQPGSGKTTLLGYLCLAYACGTDEPLGRLAAGAAKECPLPRDLVPVRVRLAGARFERGTAREFSRFLRGHLDQFSAAVVDAVMQVLADGRGLLCVDGLDEIGDDAERRRAARALEAWTQQHGGRCWVTTRKHDALTLVDRFTPFELPPFEPRQIHEYLVRRRDPRAAMWLQRFWDSPQMLALCRVPLLLVLALAIDGEEHRLPVDRVVLFERAIAMLVRDWNAERRPDALRRGSGEVVDADEILRALAAAAMRLYEQRRLAQPVAREELHRLLATELGRPSRADGALEVFVDKAGLLIAEGDRLRFWHPSFGEFLAAKALAAAARERPARLLRLAGTSAGREVVQMALAWLRTLGGDPQLASRLFDELLEDVGGPWARLFGAHVRLAVDVAGEGHPLADDEFSRLIGCVLGLVERAPLWVNGELLTRMVAMRPNHICPPELVGRLVALVSRPSILPDPQAAAVMRWLATAAPGSVEVHACCEAELVGRDDRPTWAAVGLLRAGVVRDAIVLAAIKPLEHRFGRSSPEVELAMALDSARDGLLPALARMWAEQPGPPGVTPKRGHRDAAWCVRLALAALRALLADDDAEVFAALFAAVQVDPYADDAAGVALRWLIAHEDAARRRIGEALVGEDEVGSNAAAHTLRTMLRRDDQAEVAADVVIAALERGAGRLPSAVEVLSVLPGDSASDSQQHAVLGALCRLVAAERGEFPHALMRRWSRLADDTGSRWLIGGLLWLSTRYVSDVAGVDALADALYAAVHGAELPVAVASACLLHERWDLLYPHTRRALLQTWIRGLSHPPVRDAAWRCLQRRMNEAEQDVRATLQATMEGTDEAAATIAALLLIRDTEALPSAQAVLRRSLSSEDLDVALMALEGLQREPVVAEPEMLERWLAAEIRLSLVGRRYATVVLDRPTRALVELFLRAPWDSNAMPFRMAELERWLAHHPDALALAVAAFAGTTEPEPRAVGLLAACLDTPARIEALLALIRGEDPATHRGVLTTILLCCEWVDPDSPLHAALRSALHDLLLDDLRSDDPAVLAAAVHALDRHHLRADDVPAARGRLLAIGDAASKRRLIWRWLATESAPERREEFARRHFERSVADLVAALRTCLHDEPMAALEACLLLRRIDGDGEPLRARAWAILAGPAGEPIEGQVRLGWLFEHERTHALRQALVGARLSPRTWALLALEDLGDEIGRVALCEMLGEPGTRPSSGGLEWLLEHRPDWATWAEPWIVARIATGEVEDVVEVARRLCGEMEWKPAILASLVRRWPEWIVSQPPDRDASVAAFVGQDVAPEPALLADWRMQLQSPDRELRARVALALALSGPLDESLADVLIEVVLARLWSTSQRAELCLGRPEDAAVVTARRRARVAGCTSDQEASELLTLWSSGRDRAADSDVTLPLLRLAARHDHPEFAWFDALCLAELDEAAGVAAIVELCPRSTEAAVWLLRRGETGPAALARLWTTLERPDMSADWELALATLLPEHREESRFAAALARAAVTASTWIAEKAIRLLAEHAPERVPAVILERLAGAPERAQAGAEWLHALSRGRLPGKDLDGSSDPLTSDSEGFHPLFHDRRWSALGHTRALAFQAELLMELAPELRIDLAATAATLLGGDPMLWSDLWQRAHTGPVAPAELAEIRDIVDVRAGDRPEQILARLIWRLQLAMTTLLERGEEPPIVEMTRRHGETPEQALYDLLASLFTESHLRRFLGFGEQGYAIVRSLPGGNVSFAVLLDHALAELVRRGLIAPLWPRLRTEFLARTSDIDHVAALWSNHGA